MEQRERKFTSLFSTSVLEPSEVDFETSTDAMQAAKQLKPRGPVRHDFSETLGIGESWLGLTAFSWAWRVASGLPCVSALAAAKDGQFEHVLELHAILQEISTFAWLWYAMKPPAMSLLALHKQLPGWFYILHFRKLSDQMCIL